MYSLSIFAFTNIPLSWLKLYAKLVVVAENQKSINFDNVAWKIFPRVVMFYKTSLQEEVIVYVTNAWAKLTQ